MGSSWPELDDLIRELGNVCALPDAEGEPSPSEATMAVTKATTALAHAARTRGRSAEASLAQALLSVEEARATLQRARRVISASAARRRSAARKAASASEETTEGEVESSCIACGLAFVVRFHVAAIASVVGFPVACPYPAC